jgi:hypothetical protein
MQSLRRTSIGHEFRSSGIRLQGVVSSWLSCFPRRRGADTVAYQRHSPHRRTRLNPAPVSIIIRQVDSSSDQFPDHFTLLPGRTAITREIWEAIVSRWALRSAGGRLSDGDLGTERRWGAVVHVGVEHGQLAVDAEGAARVRTSSCPPRWSGRVVVAGLGWLPSSRRNAGPPWPVPDGVDDRSWSAGTLPGQSPGPCPLPPPPLRSG